MVIRFSRHAKRRAKLYKIQESHIETILTGLQPIEGEYEIIRDVSGYKYPQCQGHIIPDI